MNPFQTGRRPLLLPAVAALALALAACGGGTAGDVTPPVSSLGFSSALPAEHEGPLQIEGAAAASNEHREPDFFSAEPYCLLRFAGARHASGARYDVVLAFAATDRRVLAFTVTRQRGGDPWWVAAFDPPPAQAVVNLAARSVELKGLRSTQGALVDSRATLDGVLRFPTSPGQPACG